MQIVINIDEARFKDIKRIAEVQIERNHFRTAEQIIANGTPLPKRMLSVDLIIETLCPKDEDYDYPCIAPSYLKEELERLLLDDAPTIIEAESEETDEGDSNMFDTPHD